MPAEVVHTAAPRIESTFKAREVEGFLDLHFYRPLGFRLAEFFAQLKMTPAGVSLLAGVSAVSLRDIFIFTVILASTSRAWCCMSARMRSIMQMVSLRG